MINYLLDVHPSALDAVILLMYFVGAWVYRSREAVALTLLFVAVALVGEYVTPLDDVYRFLLYAAMYLLASRWLIKRIHRAVFGTLAIALYSIVYATDSWINSDVETWIWRNHEIIVCTLHIFILLLLSKIRIAVVGSRFDLERLLYRFSKVV